MSSADYSGGVPSALIVNPMASRVTPEVTVAVERALAAAGDRVETLLTEAPRHAAELAAAASHSYDRLYVFGGDGAFNEVVNGLEADVPSASSRAADERAVARARAPARPGRLRARAGRVAAGAADLARAGQRPPLHVQRRPRARRRAHPAGRRPRPPGRKRPGDLVFARALRGILAGRRFRLSRPSTVVGHGRAAFALVANCDPYTYVGSLPVHAAPTARFELGLDLVAPRAVAPWQLPRLAAWAFAGRGQVSSSQRALPPRRRRDRDRVRRPAAAPGRRRGPRRRRLGPLRGRTRRAPRRRSSAIRLGRGTGASGRTGRSADHRRWGRGGGRRGRGSRRRCAPGPLSRDGPAPNLRRALGRLPPAGPDRDVRDLLGPRGDPGRLGARAGRRGLDLPVVPGVCDRAPARDAARDRARVVARAIRPAGGTRRSTGSRRSQCRSRRTSRTRSGYAWGAKLKGRSDCAIAYFGDGATSEGAFHEGANFAAVMRAPAVLLCNNNQWAISTPLSAQTRAETLADKAVGYGMPGVRVDGGDVLAVYEATAEALDTGARRRRPDVHRGADLPRRPARDRRRPERLLGRGASRGGAPERVRRALRALPAPRRRPHRRSSPRRSRRTRSRA